MWNRTHHTNIKIYVLRVRKYIPAILYNLTKNGGNLGFIYLALGFAQGLKD
jgi:hypothetical protein